MDKYLLLRMAIVEDFVFGVDVVSAVDVVSTKFTIIMNPKNFTLYSKRNKSALPCIKLSLYLYSKFS